VVDLAKSLEELEGDAWAEPTYDSQLVTAAHGLRQKPLRDLTVEDLRLMLGQRMGLSFLLPLALDQLEGNPLAEGDFYPGDLLGVCLRLDPNSLRTHPDALERLCGIARRALRDIDDYGTDPAQLRRSIRAFLGWAAA